MRARGVLRLACLCLAVTGFGLSAVTAQAGPPGTWTQITGFGGGVTGGEEIGLERTSDGVLHVAWSRAARSGAPNLLHSALSANARTVSGPNLIVAPSLGLNPRVDLVGGPGGGLRVFFSGLSDAPFSDRMGTATSGRDGRTWALQTAPASNGTFGGGSPVYAAAGISAMMGAGGVPISMWGDSAPGASGYHVGVDPSTPDFHFGTGCCSSDPNGAREAGTGRIFYGWNRQDATRTRALVQAAGEPAQEVPNSQATQIGQRLGITGRIGSRGIYVAYTAGENRFDGVPALWRVGEPEPLYISSRRGARHTTAAPTPGGHVWVMWAREGRIWAGRTNPRGTTPGRVMPVTPPRGTVVIRNLTGEASRGALDLFALVDRGARGSGYWHQRLLPPLAVAASPERLSTRGGTVVVRVTDAGRGIGGALVRLRIGSRTVQARTGPDGRARIATGAAGRGTYTVTASARDFSDGSAPLRIG
jgi:hypothetical protein